MRRPSQSKIILNEKSLQYSEMLAADIGANYGILGIDAAKLLPKPNRKIQVQELLTETGRLTSMTDEENAAIRLQSRFIVSSQSMDSVDNYQVESAKVQKVKTIKRKKSNKDVAEAGKNLPSASYWLKKAD